MDKFNKEVTDAQANLAKISAPNLKAGERIEQVRNKEEATSKEYADALKKTKKAQQAFEKVKEERCKLFTDFFDPISQEIDGIYKVSEV